MEPSQEPSPPQPRRKDEPDEKDLRIVELLYGNRHTLKQIAEEVGLARSTVCERMKRPAVRRLLRQAQDAEVRRALMHMATFAPTLSAKLITSLVQGDMDEGERVSGIIAVLDRVLKLMPPAGPLVQVTQQQAVLPGPPQQPTGIAINPTPEAALAMQEAESLFINALARLQPQDARAAQSVPRVIEAAEFRELPGYQEVHDHEPKGPTEASEQPPGRPTGEGLPEVPAVAPDVRPVAPPTLPAPNVPAKPPVGLPAGRLGGRRRTRGLRHRGR